MATRLYFDATTASAVSPAYTASWDITSSADRLVCGTSVSDNNLATGSSYQESDASQVNVLAHQYVSSQQIPSARTISGTVRAVIGCYETNGTADGFLQMVVKVVSSDGATTRGVLYAGSALNSVSTNAGDVNEEMTIGNTAMATRIVPDQTVSNVNAQAGDRLVIELGWRATNTTTTTRGAFFRHGWQQELSDHLFVSGTNVVAATSTDLNPWVELSYDVFGTETGGGDFESIGAGTIAFTYQNAAIDESSGICESRLHPGYMYTHNDSGDTNRVFMVDMSDGSLAATLTLSGVSNVDWEDIAYYNGAIYVADIGNNSGTRTNQKIVKFDEPATIATATVAATSYPISFSTGSSLDCETFMINPTDGSTYIYMKANSNVSASGLFQGPVVSSLNTGSSNVFDKILNHSIQQVTAGDFSQSGNYYVLSTNGSDPNFSTYGGMYVFDAATHVELGRRQGDKTSPVHPSEAVCWSADDAYLYRTFDGGGTANMPVYRYPVAYGAGTGGGGILANAGSDQTNIEALTTVTVSGQASGGTGSYVHNWSQTAGPSVTFTGTGASQTFLAPASLLGTTVTLEYTADDGSNTGSDTIDITVLPHPYWSAQSGTLRPYKPYFAANQTGDLPALSTISATTFKSYFGTRIFPSYNGKTGGELVTNHSWLTNLGITWVSHKLTPSIASDSGITTLIQNLSSAGIQSVLTVGEPFTTYTNGEWNTMMNALTGPLAGCVTMVTGQNEVNNVRGGGTLPSDWKEQARDHQIELWNRMTTTVNPTLVGNSHPAILIGNPNLWSGNVTTHDTDLAAFAPMVKNYANAISYHLYPRGGDPTWNLDNFITEYKAAYGSDRPIWCTEAGYFAAANYTGGAKNVTNWAHDIYIRKMWLEYASRGAWVSQFEFLDDPDPTDSLRESNFGLVETPSVAYTSWTAKTD
ncbi:hypothetical protein KDA14_01720, partial [Candidatus Saccharibacteria bacterium]|nr:hypothetical protein [Candidatus Saccharibacteria bacterium]